MCEYENPLRPPLELLRPHESHGQSKSKADILQVGDNADKVARFITFADATALVEDSALPQTPEELGELARRLVLELEQRGIRTALNTIVPMKDKDFNDALFITAYNIKFAGELETLPLDEQRRCVLAQKDLWEKLYGYYEAKIHSHEPFLWDITPSYQYAWGTREGDTENHLYLVDVDTRISTKRQRLLSCLNHLSFQVNIAKASARFKKFPEISLDELLKQVQKAKEMVASSL